MDISSLLSPSDESSPAPVVPSPRPQPSSHSGTSSLGNAGNGSASTPVNQLSPEKHSPPREETRPPLVTTVTTDSIMSDAMNQDTTWQIPAPVLQMLSEDDYKDIDIRLAALRDQPYQYASHVQLIQLLRKAFLAHGDIEGKRMLLAEVRRAREGMLEKFPMKEHLWLEYIQDESGMAANLDERILAMDIFTRAVEAQIASVRLWLCYGEFVEQQFKDGTGQNGNAAIAVEEKVALAESFPFDVVLETFQRGAEATSRDMADSHLVWDRYRDLLVQDLEAAPGQEKVERLFNVYKDRISIPHATIAETWSAFSSFVTKYDEANYESTMLSSNKLYNAASEKYSEREIFEVKLRRAREASDAEKQGPQLEEWGLWAEYLAWEQKRSKKKLDVDMICALYERCLLRFGEQAKVWEDYSYFVIEKARSSLEVTTLLQRATKHCPWSGELWAQYIIALERELKPFEDVSDVKHKATTTQLLDIGGLEELIKVNTAWCGFLKRRAFGTEATEDDLDLAEMGIREAVSEATKCVDPHYRLQRIQINFYTLARKLEDARQIWDDIRGLFKDSYEFWLRYYEWELANGTKKKAEQVISKAVESYKKGLDWPEKVLETWKSHVEDYGNVDEVQQMLVRYRKVMSEVVERRQQEAAAHQQAYTVEQPVQASVEEPVTEATSLGKSIKRRRSEAEVAEQKPAKKTKGEPVQPPAAPAGPTKGSKDQTHATASQIAKRDRENLTIIVKGLPSTYTETKVRQFFRDCGYINSIKLVTEEDGSSATATVEFESKDDVLAAQTKDQKSVEGHIIQVQVGTGATLYVTNFPPLADVPYIRDLFKEYGEVVDVRFPSLKGNAHRRFCYVQLDSAEAAKRATALHGKKLGNKETLTVYVSDPGKRKERSGAVYEGREVMVRNISYQAKAKHLQPMAEKYGKVESVRLPPGKTATQHKGFAFIVYSTKEEAEAAVAGINGASLKARQLTAVIADPSYDKKQKPGNAVAVGEGASPASQDGAPVDHRVVKEKTLGVMNLPDTVNDRRVRSLFEPHGPLVKVQLRPDKGGAVVEFENIADAGKAQLALDGKEIDGSTIEIRSSKELMSKGQPVIRKTKGFEKKGFVAPPRQSLLPQGTGPKKRGTLGFSGALARKKDEAGDKDVAMQDADGAAATAEIEGGAPIPPAKQGMSNADFKKKFFN